MRNDGTVVHQKTLYQLLELIRPPYVFVEERLNGRLYLTHRGEQLKYRKLVSARAKAVAKKEAPGKGNPIGHPPPKDHPWKRLPAVRR